jgi:hypothetical protein
MRVPGDGREHREQYVEYLARSLDEHARVAASASW